MSTTFASLTDEVLSNIQGFTASPDQMTYLVASMTSSDTSILVNDATNVSRGMIEIGGELIWVQSVDTSSNTLTTLPNGRGWRGTTAAAHSDNDTVVISPTIPTSVVKREINNEIAALYPNVFGVGTTEFTYDSVIKDAWELPADAEAILDVRWKDFLNNWQRIRGWEIEHSSDTTTFATGISLRISSLIPISRTVQVVYIKKPVALVNDADVFETVTGLSTGAKDLVVMGSMIRILPMLDVARLGVQYAPAEELAQPRPLGSALQIAKELRNTYQQRLLQERTILAKRYPARVHLTR